MGNAEYLHTARAPRQARQLVPLDGSQGMLCKLRKHSNSVGHWGYIEFFMVPVGAMQCLDESVLGVLQNSFISLGQFSHPLDRPGALKTPQHHGVSESMVPKVWLDQQHQLHQGMCWICRLTSPTQKYWVWRWSLIIQVFIRPLKNSACRFKCENLLQRAKKRKKEWATAWEGAPEGSGWQAGGLEVEFCLFWLTGRETVWRPSGVSVRLWKPPSLSLSRLFTSAVISWKLSQTICEQMGVAIFQENFIKTDPGMNWPAGCGLPTYINTTASLEKIKQKKPQKIWPLWVQVPERQWWAGAKWKSPLLAWDTLYSFPQSQLFSLKY